MTPAPISHFYDYMAFATFSNSLDQLPLPIPPLTFFVILNPFPLSKVPECFLFLFTYNFIYLFYFIIVVPVLFQHSLQDFEDQIVNNLDHIFSVEPLKIKSPSTDAEVSLALRVLEGCCLLHKESTVLAHHFKATQVDFIKPLLYYMH